MRTEHKLFLILLFAAILQSIYYYPKMPDMMASHFGNRGFPNGWSSKNTFFLIYSGAIAMIGLIFFSLPLSFKLFPDSRINLPNKDYWLSPERREETIAFINKQMTIFGMATLVLMIATFELVFRTNQQKIPHLSSSMWLFLAGYVIFTIIWLVQFIRRFYKKPEHGERRRQ